jgi:hypothetical protein
MLYTHILLRLVVVVHHHRQKGIRRLKMRKVFDSDFSFRKKVVPESSSGKHSSHFCLMAAAIIISNLLLSLFHRTLRAHLICKSGWGEGGKKSTFSGIRPYPNVVYGPQLSLLREKENFPRFFAHNDIWVNGNFL